MEGFSSAPPLLPSIRPALLGMGKCLYAALIGRSAMDVVQNRLRYCHNESQRLPFIYLFVFFFGGLLLYSFMWCKARGREGARLLGVPLTSWVAGGELREMDVGSARGLVLSLRVTGEDEEEATEALVICSQ
ncbi:hypothetical protein NHX12_004045 [Muraenolepis orangiensis]|uniref:Uncharacterized protein n=1 Tax=Muraenolepis orangiensis TaxID=630683 RepID=A0A9Q0DWB4_9TELE|nr:hypothetical protein NHX12_004045 [Muraenolepis orangiensis]